MQNSGSILMFQLLKILVTLVGNYVTLWSYCAMNGTHTVVMTAIAAKIIQLNISDDTLQVDLEDGRTIAVPIGWYPRLAYATQPEREHFQISGAGYGIHWPDLDEDIGVEGMLLGKKSGESPTSFARWLERRGATERGVQQTLPTPA